MSTVFGIQKRMRELGRVRMGEKGTKGEPKRLHEFRLTSHSQSLLEAAATLWGGEVKEWEGAPDEGTWELYTETSSLPILFPPVYSSRDGSPAAPFNQAYELWSGGGCVRRCDGITETLSDSPCMCDPEKRACDIVTRVRFMLPDIPEVGTWRLDAGGINAAMEIPATLDFLAQAATRGGMIPAVLRMEQRSSKIEGQTRRYVVPVFDLPGVRISDFLPAELDERPLYEPPRPISRAKAELPPPVPTPAEPDPTTDQPDDDFGKQPAIPMPLADEPKEEPDAGDGDSGAPEPAPAPEPEPEPEPKKKPAAKVKLATTADRRLIFQKAAELDIDTERVGELMVEVCGDVVLGENGVPDSSLIPKSMVPNVITVLEAEGK